MDNLRTAMLLASGKWYVERYDSRGAKGKAMSSEETSMGAPVHAAAIWQRAGLTIDKASEEIKKMGEAVAKVPFLDRKELRLILMGAYRLEWGPLRFFHPGWWDAFLST